MYIYIYTWLCVCVFISRTLGVRWSETTALLRGNLQPVITLWIGCIGNFRGPREEINGFYQQKWKATKALAAQWAHDYKTIHATGICHIGNNGK